MDERTTEVHGPYKRLNGFAYVSLIVHFYLCDFLWWKNCLQCTSTIPKITKLDYEYVCLVECERDPIRGNFKWWEVSVYKLQLRDHYKLLITGRIHTNARKHPQNTNISKSTLYGVHVHISSDVEQLKADVISIELTIDYIRFHTRLQSKAQQKKPTSCVSARRFLK